MILLQNFLRLLNIPCNRHPLLRLYSAQCTIPWIKPRYGNHVSLCHIKLKAMDPVHTMPNVYFSQSTKCCTGKRVSHGQEKRRKKKELSRKTYSQQSKKRTTGRSKITRGELKNKREYERLIYGPLTRKNDRLIRFMKSEKTDLSRMNKIKFLLGLGYDLGSSLDYTCFYDMVQNITRTPLEEIKRKAAIIRVVSPVILPDFPLFNTVNNQFEIYLGEHLKNISTPDINGTEDLVRRLWKSGHINDSFVKDFKQMMYHECATFKKDELLIKKVAGMLEDGFSLDDIVYHHTDLLYTDENDSNYKAFALKKRFQCQQRNTLDYYEGKLVLCFDIKRSNPVLHRLVYRYKIALQYLQCLLSHEFHTQQEWLDYLQKFEVLKEDGYNDDDLTELKYDFTDLNLFKHILARKRVIVPNLRLPLNIFCEDGNPEKYLLNAYVYMNADKTLDCDVGGLERINQVNLKIEGHNIIKVSSWTLQHSMNAGLEAMNEISINSRLSYIDIVDIKTHFRKKPFQDNPYAVIMIKEFTKKRRKEVRKLLGEGHAKKIIRHVAFNLDYEETLAYLLKIGFTMEHIKACPLVLGHDEHLLDYNYRQLYKKKELRSYKHLLSDPVKRLNLLLYFTEKDLFSGYDEENDV